MPFVDKPNEIKSHLVSFSSGPSLPSNSRNINTTKSHLLMNRFEQTLKQGVWDEQQQQQW